MDALTFFQQSAGRWRSQRTTHHLAFKRAEVGATEIQVEALTASAPEIRALCELHHIDPSTAVGGCRVQWKGSMSWDQQGENHDGKTVFALVPNAADPSQGQLLRDLGYAEIVPVIGVYQIDAEEGLVLTTEYETMSSVERFWFVNPNLRVRSSTVKRFGGFSTASFATETRIDLDLAEVSPSQEETTQPYVSFFGW